MAAIDNLYLNNYHDSYVFRKWCENKRPTLLENVCDFPLSEKQLDEWRETIYERDKEINDHFCEMYSVSKGRDYAMKVLHQEYISQGCDDESRLHVDEEIDYIIEKHNKLKYKETYKHDLAFPVANFTEKQDNWLKLHCPLDFVRKYLHESFGVE